MEAQADKWKDVVERAIASGGDIEIVYIKKNDSHEEAVSTVLTPKVIEVKDEADKTFIRVKNRNDEWRTYLVSGIKYIMDV